MTTTVAPPAAKAGLPPGPRSKLLSTYRLLTDPHLWFPRWRERYGDPFTVPAMNGTVVLTGEPDGIKEIFGAHPDTYDVFAAEAAAPLVGANSLFMTAGPRHRRDRKLLAPPFNGKRMRAYGELMADTARRHTEGFSTDVPVVGMELGQAISLEVIIRAVFGVEEPERVEAFKRAITAATESISASFIFFRFLQRPWFPPWKRFRARYAELDRLLRDQIARARADGASPEAIISLLLHVRDEDGEPLSDDELRDQLLTLLVAGHETTGVALAWALYWIHRTPGVIERLRDELTDLGPDPDPDALARLPYLDATLNESLRMSPILTEVLRTLTRPFELCGHALPAGVTVSASTLLAHYREETFPDPYRFDPERFLGRRYSAYEFLPFGGGNRRCLGAAFASYELKIVLATIIRGWQLELVSTTVPPVRRNIVMAPRGGVVLLPRPA